MVLGLAALRRDQVLAWSEQHPWLDSLLVAPLAFFPLALITTRAAGPQPS